MLFFDSPLCDKFVKILSLQTITILTNIMYMTLKLIYHEKRQGLYVSYPFDQCQCDQGN
jgi:hypothetical protein